MDNQKLYDKINQLPSLLGWKSCGAKVMVAKDSVLELVRQLDEPQKVVVPKFVAEWIESNRDCRLDELYHRTEASLNVYNWVFPKNNGIDNTSLLARAWLDGYEVEQEKLYTVEIQNNGCTLVLASTNGRLSLRNGYKHNPTELTEAEIRKDFDWAWQAGFAKEVG